MFYSNTNDHLHLTTRGQYSTSSYTYIRLTHLLETDLLETHLPARLNFLWQWWLVIPGQIPVGRRVKNGSNVG